MIKEGRIYIIKNTINSKVYIGQTKVSIKLRFQNHLSAARKGKDYVIGKAIRKYGEDKFYIELIEECPVEKLNEREIYWISFYNASNYKYGYNMSKGGNVTRTTKELDNSIIIELFNSGISAYKIAKILHVGIPNITAIFKEYNIHYGVDLQRLNDEITEKIIYLYSLGYSSLDISKKFNINKSTVLRVLKRNNIKPRTFKETKNLKRNLSTL